MMDFELSQEQEALRDLAEEIFATETNAERVRAVERGSDGFDRELWSALAVAGVLAACLPVDAGGSGLGLVELALVLEAQGRAVAPVPVWPTLVAARAVARASSGLWPAVASGDVVLSLAGADHVEADASRLTGAAPLVPWAPHADHLVVAARDRGVFLVELRSPGVSLLPVDTTSHEPTADVVLDGVVAQRISGVDGLSALEEDTLVALAALQLGVADGALTRTAAYVSQREQFGRPLSTFQAVGQAAADAFITIEAMRATVLQAAWRLDAGLPATAEVLVAAWWASDGGQRVVYECQHLHGGLGADVDFPIHRYFLWGLQLASRLGAAAEVLARLGREIASRGGEEA
jgi:alkylation response protein AidB-like acyl-CoA dehydrogenase